MDGHDPEVLRLTQETTRLVTRAELLYNDLVQLQNQIVEFLDRASRYAENKEIAPP